MTEPIRKYAKTKREKNPDTPAFVGKYYLTNATLLPAVIEAKEKGIVTEKLGKMILTLTQNYAKSPKFGGYTYRDEMVSEALINLCKNALAFNPEKSNNPFAFYTTCIHNSFLQFLNHEKKHRQARDKLLIEAGSNPSFNYEMEVRSNSEGESSIKDELLNLQSEIEEAKERLEKDRLQELKKAEIQQQSDLMSF